MENKCRRLRRRKKRILFCSCGVRSCCGCGVCGCYGCACGYVRGCRCGDCDGCGHCIRPDDTLPNTLRSSLIEALTIVMLIMLVTNALLSIPSTFTKVSAAHMRIPERIHRIRKLQTVRHRPRWYRRGDYRRPVRLNNTVNTPLHRQSSSISSSSYNVSITVPSRKQLITPLDGTVKGYGVLFDITNYNPFQKSISIASFDIRISTQSDGVPIQVYTRLGTYQGYTDDITPSGGWTEIFNGRIDGKGDDELTPITSEFTLGDSGDGEDREGVILPPSATRSFYVTLSTANLRYTKKRESTIERVLAEDEFLQINVGAGVGSGRLPYGAVYENRAFNGRIWYKVFQAGGSEGSLDILHDEEDAKMDVSPVTETETEAEAEMNTVAGTTSSSSSPPGEQSHTFQGLIYTTTLPPPRTSPSTQAIVQSMSDLGGGGTLSTTYDTDNASYGIMFELVPFRDIIVTSLDIHTDLRASAFMLNNRSPAVIEVFTKQGSYKEIDDMGWKPICYSTLQNPRGIYTPTSIPTADFKPLPLKAGTKQSLYITFQTDNLLYTDAGVSSLSWEYSNEDLEVLVGSGVTSYPLGPKVPDRVFNGAIHYDYPRDHDGDGGGEDDRHSVTLSTTLDADNQSYGTMFEIVTKQELSFYSLDIHTDIIASRQQQGTLVEVWTKPGTFRGYENQGSKWNMLTTPNCTVSSKGMYRFTSIPKQCFTKPIALTAGSMQSFYVTLATEHLLYTNWNEEKHRSDGTVYTKNEDMEIWVGTGVTGYPFGPNTVKGRIFNGALHYHLGLPLVEPAQMEQTETETETAKEATKEEEEELVGEVIPVTTAPPSLSETNDNDGDSVYDHNEELVELPSDPPLATTGNDITQGDGNVEVNDHIKESVAVPTNPFETTGGGNTNGDKDGKNDREDDEVGVTVILATSPSSSSSLSQSGGNTDEQHLEISTNEDIEETIPVSKCLSHERNIDGYQIPFYGLPGALLTTYEGGNDSYGILFQIKTSKYANLVIRSLDIHTPSRSTVNVRVWAKKEDDHEASDTGSDEDDILPSTFLQNSDWTSWMLLSASTIRGKGLAMRTVIPERDFLPLFVSMGETWFIYLSLDEPHLTYTDYDFTTRSSASSNAGGVGTVQKSNGDMSVLVGYGVLQYPFGALDLNKEFNGIVHYSVLPRVVRPPQPPPASTDPSLSSISTMAQLKEEEGESEAAATLAPSIPVFTQQRLQIVGLISNDNEDVDGAENLPVVRNRRQQRQRQPEHLRSLPGEVNVVKDNDDTATRMMDEDDILYMECVSLKFLKNLISDGSIDTDMSEMEITSVLITELVAVLDFDTDVPRYRINSKGDDSDDGSRKLRRSMEQRGEDSSSLSLLSEQTRVKADWQKISPQQRQHTLRTLQSSKDGGMVGDVSLPQEEVVQEEEEVVQEEEQVMGGEHAGGVEQHQHQQHQGGSDTDDSSHVLIIFLTVTGEYLPRNGNGGGDDDGFNNSTNRNASANFSLMVESAFNDHGPARLLPLLQSYRDFQHITQVTSETFSSPQANRHGGTDDNDSSFPTRGDFDDLEGGNIGIDGSVNERKGHGSSTENDKKLSLVSILLLAFSILSALICLLASTFVSILLWNKKKGDRAINRDNNDGNADDNGTYQNFTNESSDDGTDYYGDGGDNGGGAVSSNYIFSSLSLGMNKNDKNEDEDDTYFSGSKSSVNIFPQFEHESSNQNESFRPIMPSDHSMGSLISIPEDEEVDGNCTFGQTYVRKKKTKKKDNEEE